ncbi:hypothetical protein ACJMK2_038798 [Sinanodonta woodiana]|uniref:Uncharacterized protein n=1 Tax=Sinanodonta woodiana TaxID=1069815 RepID=A0ABD3WA17_SINWO
MYRHIDVNLSKYVKSDIYLRTIRVDGRISREEALRRLQTAGVDVSDMEGYYKEGINAPWHAVLKSQEKARNVAGDGIKYIARLEIDLKIHWLPLFVDVVKRLWTSS